MPSKNITAVGTSPIIATSSGRIGTLLTNDSDYNVFWRQNGAVTATTGPSKGHILRPKGGSVFLSSFAAKLPVYACVAAGDPAVEITVEEYMS